MRRRIAAALVRCSVVITALSVSQSSARSESWAAYTLWITDHAWVVKKLFERFLRDVNKLQMQQHLEARAQGDTERSRERGPG